MMSTLRLVQGVQVGRSDPLDHRRSDYTRISQTWISESYISAVKYRKNSCCSPMIHIFVRTGPMEGEIGKNSAQVRGSRDREGGPIGRPGTSIRFDNMQARRSVITQSGKWGKKVT